MLAWALGGLGLALAAGAFAAAPARAQGDEPTAEATLHVRQQGERVLAAIAIAVRPGWHLYHEDLGPADAVGMPTAVAFSGPALAWTKVRFPKPHRYEQPGLGADGKDTWILGHEGVVVLHAEAPARTPGPGSGPGGPALDLAAIRAEVEGLTCLDDGSCVPVRWALAPSGPGSDALFAFADGPPTPVSPGEPTGTDTSTSTAASTSAPAGMPVAYAVEGGGGDPARSLGAWLAIAFVAGMILNVMPCVLPVISIKVLSFVQQAGESRGRVLALGLVFSAGIIVVFLALAVSSIVLGTAWGEQFQKPGFVIAMTAIVFAFALSLFGVFELGVPVPVGGSGFVRREGLGDAFVKGMLATALATPCTGPFLGSTLAWTLTQPPGVVVLVFLALGVGMAFPYVVLTANPALLRLLPRPGRWMETFKQAMGFLLAATVVYLLSLLDGARLIPVLALLGFVGLGCWVWGRFAGHGEGLGQRLAVLGASLTIAGAGSWVSLGPFAHALEPETGWESYDPGRFAALQREGKNIFVDFTADWCPNCKVNERFVYDTDEALALYAEKGVVRIKADMTHEGPRTREIAALREALGARSIPFMAVFPRGAPERPVVRHDIVRKGDFLAILRGLPDP